MARLTHRMGLLGSVLVVTLIDQPSASGLSWVPTGSMQLSRALFGAVCLDPNPTFPFACPSSSKVLVAGGVYEGSGASLYTETAELYDPSTGTWSPTGSMNLGRTTFTLTRLADGKILAVGGRLTVSSQVTETAELYDPDTGTWSYTGSMATARANHTATLLEDGRVLVAAGLIDNTPPYPPTALAEIYDPSMGTFSPTGALVEARDLPAATRLANGDVFVAGGRDNSGALDSAEVYSVATGLWHTVGSMALAREAVSVTLLQDDRVLIAGGQTTGEVPLNAVDLTDAGGESFPASCAPGCNLGSARRYHRAVVLPNEKVLATGGLASPDTTEEFDPTTDTWAPSATMNVTRNAHEAILLEAGVLVMGGYGTGITPTASAEILSCGNGVVDVNEECDDGNLAGGDGCSPACAADCPPAPVSNCRTSGRSILLLKDKTPDSKDRLLWKWVKGAATATIEFGDPLTTAHYALCLYAGSAASLITEAAIQAGSPPWQALGDKGYRYLDNTSVQDGIQKILLKGKADADKSKVLWKGRGDQLDDLLPGTLPLPPAGFPVTVQALNSETTVCFESTFQEADVRSNRADQLKLNGSSP